MSEIKTQVIGQGTYGCVHYPPLLCDGSKDRDLDQISKLMDTDEANSEMEEYVLISSVDRNKEFYLGQPTLCKVGKQPYNIKAIKMCNMGDTVLKNYSDYSLMKMRNGGDSLKIFSQNMNKQVIDESNKTKITDFWICCQKLFLGLKAFQSGDIVHHDVKHQNIVYHSKRNEVKYIDFGLMTQKNNIFEKMKKEGFWLAMFHWSFPIELGYLNKKIFNKFSKKADIDKLHHVGKLIDEIKTYTQSSNNDTTNISNESLAFITLLNEVHCKENAHYCTKTIEDVMEDYLNTLKTLKKKNYKQIVDKSYKTVDSYGLGLSLMYVLNHVNKFMENDFAKELGDLFYNMYHPNIQIRYEIETALTKYEEILNKYILKDQNKEFLNNHVQTMSKSKKSVMNQIQSTSLEDISLSSRKMLDSLTVDPVRKCPDGKIFNPLTRRCVKKCKDGYSRDSSFKCKKVLEECPHEKIRNPLTRRCVKKCKDNEIRNKKFRCVKTRKNRS